MVVHLTVLDGPDVVDLDKVGGRFAAAIRRVSGVTPPPTAPPAEKRSWRGSPPNASTLFSAQSFLAVRKTPSQTSMFCTRN